MPGTLIVAAAVGLVGGLIGRGGVAAVITAWSQRNVGPATALSALEPSIVDHLHRLDAEVLELRDENRVLRREMGELRERLRGESELRRKYESMLIEHRIIDQVDQIADRIDLRDDNPPDEPPGPK